MQISRVVNGVVGFGVVGVGLASCGEGGEPTSPPISSLPELNITLAPQTQTETALEDASEVVFSFEAQQAGSTALPIFADVSFDDSILSADGPVTQLPNGLYQAKFKTRNDLGGGEYAGEINFRLCQDSACSIVYPKSEKSFSYTLIVELKPWETYQRNAAHTGYVHVRLDPSRFSPAWRWEPPDGGVFKVAANDTSVFVTRGTFPSKWVYSLDQASGAELWSYDLGVSNNVSAPALGGGRVLVLTMLAPSGDHPVTVLDAETGQFQSEMTFSSQYTDFLAPTAYEDEFYTGAGYYGNVLYQYDIADGVTNWTVERVGGKVWGATTPAVDKDYVYYYSGVALDIYNRIDGSLAYTLSDPFFSENGNAYYSAPILSSSGILAYSGTTGGLGAIEPQYRIQRQLAKYSVQNGGLVWRSAEYYWTHPAVANGVIYVARNDPPKLEALDLQTGNVLWSWTPPASDKSFHCNIVATDNLIFVSTDTSVYAIDIESAERTIVWSHDTPGCMAITPQSKLILTEGRVSGAQNHTLTSLGALSAFNLR